MQINTKNLMNDIHPQDLRQERGRNDRLQGVLVRTERNLAGKAGAETQMGLFHV